MNTTASTDPTTDTLSKPQVLVVDDTPDNLALMSDLLRDTCKVRVRLKNKKRHSWREVENKFWYFF